MEDDITDSKLKEKLILLDKNTKAWSGDEFLRNLQQLQNPSSSSTPMEADQVQFGQKGQREEQRQDEGQEGRLVWNAIWWQEWWWKEWLKEQRKT